MLPKFNKEGYLPMGIHKATLNEIKQRFGSSSSKRKELFESFQSLLQLLEKYKKSIKRFLLNGSYVTSKESPEDFDCILVVKNDFDFNSFEAKQLRHSKELFNGHILMTMEEDIINYHDAVDFFGHDRDRKAKGLVEVIL